VRGSTSATALLSAWKPMEPTKAKQSTSKSQRHLPRTGLTVLQRSVSTGIRAVATSDICLPCTSPMIFTWTLGKCGVEEDER